MIFYMQKNSMEILLSRIVAYFNNKNKNGE